MVYTLYVEDGRSVIVLLALGPVRPCCSCTGREPGTPGRHGHLSSSSMLSDPAAITGADDTATADFIARWQGAAASELAS